MAEEKQNGRVTHPICDREATLVYLANQACITPHILDTKRNAYAQTAVPPYAVRMKPGAPIATPLDWEELSDRHLHSQTYAIGNTFRRLGQKPDP
ncbi:non-homologous end-joining DNA ligase LigD [Myxosarcina sp. GI1(2024)]